MPVIDVHTHVWPDAVAPRAIDALTDGARPQPYYDGTVDGLVRQMDAVGVDVSVLQPVATRPDQVRSINDFSASLRTPRLVAFGAMHPGLDDPEREVERMAELGIRGMKFHPEFQDFDPNDPRMHRIYRRAADLGLIILFHAGVDPAYETVRGVPTTFKRIITGYPDLTIILAHLGGYRVWEDVAEHLMGERVYLDTAYTLGHLPAADVAAIIRGHGTDRILFGSDGPWRDAADDIRELAELGLEHDQLEAIYWRNAAQLLDLPL